MNCLFLLLLLSCCGGNSWGSNNCGNNSCVSRPMPRPAGKCCEEERERDCCCDVPGMDRRPIMSPPPRRDFPGLGETCGCEEKSE